MPLVLSVTSGKGGVGKTNLSVNLAYCLSRMGRNVVLLDADLGLANVDILLGLTPQRNLFHLFHEGVDLRQILMETPFGFSILPASSGVSDMAMAPFLVEMTDAKGHTRFLTISFTAVTLDPAVEVEFRRNITVVRDAVYYYLKNKNMDFLTDKKNIDTLKKDVLSVINQFIGTQPLDNLLIEEYLVK